VADQLLVEGEGLVEEEEEGLQLVEGTFQATSWEEVETLPHKLNIILSIQNKQKMSDYVRIMLVFSVLFLINHTNTFTWWWKWWPVCCSLVVGRSLLTRDGRRWYCTSQYTFSTCWARLHSLKP